MLKVISGVQALEEYGSLIQAVILGKISFPENCANFHWGGADWKTLFCTATNSSDVLPVKIGPRSEPFMTNVSLSDTNADLTNAALIIQDMQVDAVGENGASSDSGAFQHCQDQNCLIKHCKLS